MPDLVPLFKFCPSVVLQSLREAHISSAVSSIRHIGGSYFELYV